MLSSRVLQRISIGVEFQLRSHVTKLRQKGTCTPSTSSTGLCCLMDCHLLDFRQLCSTIPSMCGLSATETLKQSYSVIKLERHGPLAVDTTTSELARPQLTCCSPKNTQTPTSNSKIGSTPFRERVYHYL